MDTSVSLRRKDVDSACGRLICTDGKYLPHIGPQTRFPFPPGVINNQGQNTISLSLWAQTNAGAHLTNASLFTYNQYQSGFDFSQNWEYLQPGWSSDRVQYA